MKKTYPIQKAREEDMPSVLTLLKKCELPVEDIPQENQEFWVVKTGGEITGVIGIEKYGQSGLLRSFAVDPGFRRQGIGAGLLYHGIEEAEKLGIESLFLCTNTASLYFERHQWIYVKRESAPEQVQQSDEFRSPWPASTSCMFLPVRQGVVKKAVQTFLLGFNCAQSVFASFAPALGLGEKDALKISSGFGAGICYKGEICGAVSGAYMVMGLKYGRWKSEDTEARDKTYALMREFDTQFIDRNGSLYCNHLLEGDMTTPEGRKKINDEHRFNTHCPRFVMDAADIAEKLIE